MSRADAAEVLADDRVWFAVGIVRARPNEDKHFEAITKDGKLVDVSVEVDIMPRRESVTCRLGGFGGARGIWRIPPPGTEVAVAIPGGELEGGPVIVAVLSSRDVPAGLDEDTLVVSNPKRVLVYSEDDKVFLGSNDGTGCKGVAYKDGQVNLGRFTHVPASGTGVTACKLLWTPPGGGAPAEITTATELDGKITDGSATTEVKP